VLLQCEAQLHWTWPTPLRPPLVAKGRVIVDYLPYRVSARSWFYPSPSGGTDHLRFRGDFRCEPLWGNFRVAVIRSECSIVSGLVDKRRASSGYPSGQLLLRRPLGQYLGGQLTVCRQTVEEASRIQTPENGVLECVDQCSRSHCGVTALARLYRASLAVGAVLSLSPASLPPFPTGRKMAAGIARFFPTVRKFRKISIDNMPCLCASLGGGGRTPSIGPAEPGKRPSTPRSV